MSNFFKNDHARTGNRRLKELEVEFEAARQSFLNQYADLRQQASAEWYEAARRLVSDPDRLVATIEASFPNVAQMQRTFGFEVHLFQLRAPESLDIALVSHGEQEAVLAARQRAASEAADQIRRGAESFVADCVASLRQQTAQLCEEMLDSMAQARRACTRRR